jgi:hypothetical protein
MRLYQCKKPPQKDGLRCYCPILADTYADFLGRPPLRLGGASEETGAAAGS